MRHRKARAICRAIYNAVAAYTESTGADNKRVRCDNFNIGRGVVVQGDITSPLFFILALALELIMRCHDAASQDKGIKLADTIVHVLGYADDAVILDDGTP